MKKQGLPAPPDRSFSYDIVKNDTGEDMVVEDKPRQDEGDTDYRLLSGNDKGKDGSNYFRTKARVISEMK